ncbi:MAG: response regulator [Deltaproteobacteria bacterium]|nr:response regulator [Deltaproteobacteria bacterium]
MNDLEKKPRVLAVDDQPANLQVIRNILKDEYSLSFAKNGQKALEVAEKHSPDLIVLDVMMPEMDGFEACRRLKEMESTRDIPVVFVTALDSREDIRRGLGLGAFYYLTKPVDAESLRTICRTAFMEQAAIKSLKEEVQGAAESIRMMKKGEFKFQNLDHARSLAVMMAKTCPEPEKVIVGLNELFINAIEHGNLGITYEEKTTLNTKGRWEQEVRSRLVKEEYLNKEVLVEFERKEEELRFLVKDQGEGFDWKKFLDFDEKRVFDNHGRGIAMANQFSFSRLEYMGAGNEVLAVIKA